MYGIYNKEVLGLQRFKIVFLLPCECSNNNSCMYVWRFFVYYETISLSNSIQSEMKYSFHYTRTHIFSFRIIAHWSMYEEACCFTRTSSCIMVKFLLKIEFLPVIASIFMFAIPVYKQRTFLSWLSKYPPTLTHLYSSYSLSGF